VVTFALQFRVQCRKCVCACLRVCGCACLCLCACGFKCATVLRCMFRRARARVFRAAREKAVPIARISRAWRVAMALHPVASALHPGISCQERIGFAARGFEQGFGMEVKRSGTGPHCSKRDGWPLSSLTPGAINLSSSFSSTLHFSSIRLPAFRVTHPCHLSPSHHSVPLALFSFLLVSGFPSHIIFISTSFLLVLLHGRLGGTNGWIRPSQIYSGLLDGARVDSAPRRTACPSSYPPQEIPTP
jgi:hypothetical protein